MPIYAHHAKAGAGSLTDNNLIYKKDGSVVSLNDTTEPSPYYKDPIRLRISQHGYKPVEYLVTYFKPLTQIEF